MSNIAKNNDGTRRGPTFSASLLTGTREGLEAGLVDRRQVANVARSMNVDPQVFLNAVDLTGKFPDSSDWADSITTTSSGDKLISINIKTNGATK